MAAPFLIQAVSDLLADIPDEGKTLLDVSCKEGDVLTSLQHRHFTLRGTNFEAGGPDKNGIPIDYGVDLREPLPYDDASFDVVLLVEVVEHLSDHQAALGELARILKPGGALILTTPNVMRLNSRVHFMLSGYHKTKRRFIPFETPLNHAHRFHNYPIELPILYYLCKQNGLHLERLVTARSSSTHGSCWRRWAYPCWPIPGIRCGYARKSRTSDRRNRKLLRWLCHPRLLMEDNLVLRLRKVETA